MLDLDSLEISADEKDCMYQCFDDCLGFFAQGKLTAQGKLLQQDTFFVTEQDSGVLSRSKERRVFLFEQIVIFSELLRKGSSTPGYQFKKSIKVHSAQVRFKFNKKQNTQCLYVNLLCAGELPEHGGTCGERPL